MPMEGGEDDESWWVVKEERYRQSWQKPGVKQMEREAGRQTGRHRQRHAYRPRHAYGLRRTYRLRHSYRQRHTFTHRLRHTQAERQEKKNTLLCIQQSDPAVFASLIIFFFLFINLFQPRFLAFLSVWICNHASWEINLRCLERYSLHRNDFLYPILNASRWIGSI